MSESWEVKKIGEVCDTSAGGTPLKSHKEYYENGTVPWLRSGEVGQGEIYRSEKFITKKGLKNSSAKLFPRNSVLVAMYGATAGEAGILRFEAATNQAVCAILPNDLMSPKYIYYYLLFYKKRLVAKAVGNAQSNLSQKKIKNIELPVPSLDDQKCIVSILDKVFEAIDQAKLNIERNIKNAEELFESKLNQIFDKLYSKYELSTIGDQFDTGAGGTPLKSQKDYYEGGTIPWLRSGEVKQGNIYEAENYITKKGLDESSATLFPKDTVLVAMYGATAGDVGILRIEASTNQAVCGIYPTDEYLPEFLFQIIKFQREHLLRQKVGNAQPNLSQTKIKKLDIPVLPVKIQNKIVSDLSDLNYELNQLKKGYKNKLKNLEELRNSILNEAFSGKLIQKEKLVA